MSRQSALRFPPAAVFSRAVAADALPAALRLRSAEWGVLFSVTGRHTVAQLGALLRVDRSSLEDALASLIERGLVVERSLSLDEYLAAAATVGDTESLTLGEFLRARDGVPRDPAPSDPAADDAAEPPFEPLPLPEFEDRAMPDRPAGPRALSLRALIRLFLERAATAEAGQLDVYRTFLRIEPQLLRRNGLTTLRFEDDRTVVDAELIAAIAASATETLGGPLPGEVYLPAVS